MGIFVDGGVTTPNPRTVRTGVTGLSNCFYISTTNSRNTNHQPVPLGLVVVDGFLLVLLRDRLGTTYLVCYGFSGGGVCIRHDYLFTEHTTFTILNHFNSSSGFNSGHINYATTV